MNGEKRWEGAGIGLKAMTGADALSIGDVPPRSAAIGVMMLETRFARPVGDIGNPNTFDFPVRYEIVRGASVRRALTGRADGLLDPFVAAGRRLVARGAVALTTSCGFLALLQRELADALPVPVATSSLLQLAWLAPLMPAGRRCGVITADRVSLGPDHLRACGAPPDTPIEGMAPDGAFAHHVLGDRPGIDRAAVRAELLSAGRRLHGRVPGLGAVVLECTNLSPYAGALADDLGVPVYDACTMVAWLWHGTAGHRTLGM